ncbi:hypothetical protein B0J12DRAFT_737177 [Macrophomina phaseolina]|uniref:Secreted protein n=1 Tax=Macrophomina phaseolina TaxID=35725 RepID=A0ABQ8GML1_9PEZI|nr:hypothetical protein B0J12DRAFT_737177 [Macrophomina phaseolina]
MRDFQSSRYLFAFFFLLAPLASAQTTAPLATTSSCPPQPVVTQTISMCRVTRISTVWVTPSIATSLATVHR